MSKQTTSQTFDLSQSNARRFIIPRVISKNQEPNIKKDNPQEKQKQSIQQLATNYYRQYLHLFKENEILNAQLQLVRYQRQQMLSRLSLIQAEIRDSQAKQKRHRRGADQINRDYQCPAGNCSKSYGSQGSLIQHLKLKHLQFYEQGKHQEYLALKCGKPFQLKE